MKDFIILDGKTYVDTKYLECQYYFARDKALYFNDKGLTTIKVLKDFFAYIYDSRISEIEILDLCVNKLTSITCLMFHQSGLYRLKTLRMDHNRITSLRGVRTLLYLERFSLHDNRVKEIKFLEELSRLQHLTLSSNRIEVIKGLTRQFKLLYLELSHNKISVIENLEKLFSLKELYLSNNKISKIQNVNHLKKVVKLDLSHNNISVIENIEGMESLRELVLTGNPITAISDASERYIVEKEINVKMKCIKSGVIILDYKQIKYSVELKINNKYKG